MANFFEYIISIKDKASAAAQKIESTVGRASHKLREMKKSSDLIPHSINEIRNKLNDLANERGTTHSKMRIRELNGQIRKLEASARRLENLPPPGFAARLRNASGAVGKFGPMIAGAFSISAITSFGRSVIDTTAKYQKFEAVLSTQLGGEAAGKQAMDMIQKFAAETPFQVDELTNSYAKLASQGFRPTENQLTNLGDLAASMGKPFDQLAEAVLDAQTGEFERLKEFGIKARQSGDKVQMTFKGQTTVIDKSSGAMQEYLLSLGKMPGVVGSMAAISETTGGKLSNMSDATDNLKKNLGESLKPIIDKIIDAIKSFVEKLQLVSNWMKAHLQEIKFFAITIGLAAIGIAAVTIATWAWNTSLWANPITWVVAGVIALAAIIALLITYFDGWGNAWDNLMKGLKYTWYAFTANFKLDWLKTVDLFMKGIEWIERGWYKVKGLWDSEGAAKGLARLNNEAEQRSRQIAYQKGLAETFNKIADDAFGNVLGKNGLHRNSATLSGTVNKIKDAVLPGGANPTGAPVAPGDKTKPSRDAVATGGTKNTTINIQIGKQIESLTVVSNNLKEGAMKIRDIIVEEMTRAAGRAGALAG